MFDMSFNDIKLNHKENVKKNIFLIFCFIVAIMQLSCNQNAKQNNIESCVFDKKNDQLIITKENYKLTIYLYGKQIEEGEYQIFGSDQEELLEGTLEKDITVDVKTTLFITYFDEIIKVTGTARLYKPNSVQQTGETLEFVYEGKLLIKK